jgi:hypothetical protein
MKETGMSGTVSNTAPLPGFEVKEFPYALAATILAKTLAPHCKLNGTVLRVLIGIEQVSAETMPAFEPLHVSRLCCHLELSLVCTYTE